MGFISRHMTFIVGLLGVVFAYLLYKYYGARFLTKRGPTAAEIAAQGTVAPGTPIYAASDIGYGVPGEYDSNTNITSNPAIGSMGNWFADFSESLNSGPNSTAPSAFLPVTSITNALALGTVVPASSTNGEGD